MMRLNAWALYLYGDKRQTVSLDTSANILFGMTQHQPSLGEFLGNLVFKTSGIWIFDLYVGDLTQIVLIV